MEKIEVDELYVQLIEETLKNKDYVLFDKLVKLLDSFPNGHAKR